MGVIGLTRSAMGVRDGIACSILKIEKNITFDKNETRFIFLCPNISGKGLGKLTPDRDKAS
jgi:hypothetical protein